MEEDEPRKVNVYKVTLLVLDFERHAEKIVMNELEDLRHLCSTVLESEMRTVDWTDKHPLNRKDTQLEAARQLFK